MKVLILAGAIAIVGVGALFFFSSPDTPPEATPATTNERAASSDTTQTNTSAERRAVPPGSYVVATEESVVTWAGRKPLLQGYLNAGTIALSSGSIDVAQNDATGSFTIDMNTLSVSDTPTKPGQESALEGHLKGERWFNVAAFPTASFAILEVTPQADSATTFTYTVRGNLTMKGQTGEITFPAQIYLDEENRLLAEAAFEIDRTKWGITAGSGSFFDNLADNVIDDMVALSFSLVAVADTQAAD